VQVEFITSSPDLKGRPERILPEFAFIGRSNCGKSSLINHFLERVRMAKISGKPGKTRLLNYFLVDDRYYLVDLPGYGFAKVGKATRAAWREIFREFLLAEDRPLALFQLLDVRHRPSQEDRQVAHWLQEAGHPFALAITKIDKVGTNVREERYQDIVSHLGVPADTPFFPTSAKLATGRDGMVAWVEALLAANVEAESFDEASDPLI